MPDEITTLIVDDHEVVREGLRLSLSRAPHIRVVGEASDGATAVALAERRKPDVVIMDVRMPGMDGLEATKILTEKVPETAVLIFTAYSERSLLGRGLDSGAKGDRKSTRLNSSHDQISYAVFCLKKKKVCFTPHSALIPLSTPRFFIIISGVN